MCVDSEVHLSSAPRRGRRDETRCTVAPDDTPHPRAARSSLTCQKHRVSLDLRSNMGNANVFDSLAFRLLCGGTKPDVYKI